MSLVLREHQKAVIEALREGFKQGHRSQLLYAATGFGKTEVAIALMKATSDNYKNAAMVLDRIVLVDQTSLRLTKYNISHGVYQAGHWKYDRAERLQVCSAQTLERRDDFPKTQLLIIDECFTGDTLISTPSGTKMISNVRCGDIVYNSVGIGIVEAVSIKPTNELYRLEFDNGTITECTGNHPFFTEFGWIKARELEVGRVFFSEQGLRLLWEGFSSEYKDRLWEESFLYELGVMESPANLLKVLLKEVKEPNAQYRVSSKDAEEIERNQAQAYQTWGQRAITAFATISNPSCTGGGMGGGAISSNPQGTLQRDISESLQDRHSKSINDDRNRAGRGESWDFREKESGQEKNRLAHFPRLVNISHIKRESVTSVFNLQVSGHPSYFADGKLVHNCHIARKQTSEFIKNNPDIKVIGLTATPFTKGLGSLYTNVVSGMSTSELVSKGWLAPLRVFIAKEIDMTGAKKVAGEWSQDVVTERGMKITGDIVNEWIKKTHEVFGRPRKTIVFCSGVAHGADLVEQFAQHGYNFVSISYKDDDEFKKLAIEDFAKPDTEIHGLIATDILTRGFDVPDVMIGVSARPFSKSLSSHVQQMGRVMRPYDGKDFALWLDHSGNYLRFRDDWDEVYEDGVKSLDDKAEKAKREPTEKEKKESKCPACSSLWSRYSDTCLVCGFVRKKRNDVSSVAGEMVELNSSNKAHKDEKQAFYSELMYIAKDKNYNINWASHKYREKFGVWPKGLYDVIKFPSQKTLTWIQHKNIAWAKKQNKVTL